MLAKMKFAGIKAENDYILWLHVKFLKMKHEKSKDLGMKFQTVKNWAQHKMMQVSGLVELTIYEHGECLLITPDARRPISTSSRDCLSKMQKRRN